MKERVLNWWMTSSNTYTYTLADALEDFCSNAPSSVHSPGPSLGRGKWLWAVAALDVIGWS